jgi:hypothetical protein
MQKVTEKPSGSGRRARSGEEPPEQLLAELLTSGRALGRVEGP